MYPSEIERRERRTLDAPLPFSGTLHDDQVLLFHEWCRLNRISERTGRRIIASGTGSVVTHLSTHRIGVTIRNNRVWQQTREK
jgi:hypothetical protein